MSSNLDVTVAETSPLAVEEEKPPAPVRRFPPPCWTQEETLALIDAYRERWYALRRGYLRTADWDAVAAAVTSRCPDASPAKTSAQCRHKMEKLRQRYRAEKQRSLASPTGRFFSSWFFFDNMDAMENGTTVASIKLNQQMAEKQVPSIDPNLLKLKINQKNGVNFIEDWTPTIMLNHGVAKTPERNNFSSKIPNGYCFNKEEMPNEVEFGSGFRVKNGISMKSKRSVMNSTSFDCDEGSEYNGSNASDGFHVRNFGENFGVSSSRRNYGGNVEPNVDSRFSTPKLGKKGVGGGGGGGGVKRGRDPMEEMVLSIRLLGEGFMKVEKMKMEMAKEVEQMRMEMEMKRNEMILQSQKQIVDAFVKVLNEVNNKNKNVKTVLPDES
ncbi:trihelix transcription factor ASIL2-like [Nicotiana sylvestris]|uniref:Uncharacterized protein LOC104237169 n=1 Tax=Nicotiana sylvestris TaxID=4096 RepID=A0A1U7XBV6_NICSY|nr:PREDICTED: uncharacterized protein LOC104237169 [Nicotiana sylvestris]